MKSYRNFILIVILLVIIVVPVRAVRADISPPPAPLLAGLAPFEYQDTKVQMIYERVEMELKTVHTFDEYDKTASQVLVTAYFVMRNQGNVPESMQAIFPMESMTDCAMGMGPLNNNTYNYYLVNEDSFEIVVDGVIAPTEKLITVHPYATEWQIDECAEMGWIGFDVHFPVDTDVTIKVSYSMTTMGGTDAMQNIYYVLETGAGWYGPIERAYVIVKFPYIVSRENILEDTTPGYQILYNEIFWSLQNIEPTNENNIRVSIVSPETWQKILSLRGQIKENSALPQAWLDLAQTYQQVAFWHGLNLRDSYYADKVIPTFENGIAANPNNANLYAFYAEFLQMDCCFYIHDGISDSDLNNVLAQVSKALALEPGHPIAIQVLKTLQSARPDFVFTPPTTIPSTATPAISNTPTETLVSSITPKSSQTPIIVTVVKTKIVTTTPLNTFTATKTAHTPSPTLTVTLTPEIETQPAAKFGCEWFAYPLLLAIGFLSGIFVSKKK